MATWNEVSFVSYVSALPVTFPLITGLELLVSPVTKPALARICEIGTEFLTGPNGAYDNCVASNLGVIDLIPGRAECSCSSSSSVEIQPGLFATGIRWSGDTKYKHDFEVPLWDRIRGVDVRPLHIGDPYTDNYRAEAEMRESPTSGEFLYRLVLVGRANSSTTFGSCNAYAIVPGGDRFSSGCQECALCPDKLSMTFDCSNVELDGGNGPVINECRDISFNTRS